jgi:hypothetical protein
MEVAHGGFQMVVAQNDLQIPYEGAAVQSMGGKGVAQEMRGDAIELTMVGRLLDGALDVGFMTTPTNDFSGMGIMTGGARGEEPGPALGMGGVGVFLGQETGQGDRDAFGLIGGGGGLGDFELSCKGCREAVRESDDAAFVALGLMDVKPSLSQIEVLDAQIKGFGDTEPARVEQVNDEPSGICSWYIDIKAAVSDHRSSSTTRWPSKCVASVIRGFTFGRDDTNFAPSGCGCSAN